MSLPVDFKFIVGLFLSLMDDLEFVDTYSFEFVDIIFFILF